MFRFLQVPQIWPTSTTSFLLLATATLNWLSHNSSQSQSYITTVGQSACLFWCQTVVGLLMWGAFSDERMGLLFINCCWSSPAQSFSGPGPTGLIIIFYSLRFETRPTWRARSPYLYPPGTGWPSYTPRHWVPFSSPPKTRRATVEEFENPPPRRGLSITVGADRTDEVSSIIACSLFPGKKRVHRAVP
jgi:hypothetical protein